MKKALLILPFLALGCAAVAPAVVPTVKTAAPCLTSPPPPLDEDSKLGIVLSRPLDDEVMGLVVKTESYGRFGGWVARTLTWGKEAWEKCGK